VLEKNVIKEENGCSVFCFSLSLECFADDPLFFDVMRCQSCGLVVAASWEGKKG
jgi:hypothetical protein